jgi:hypothetical protein
VTDLWWALDELPHLPAEAAAVRAVVMSALGASNSRGELNLGMRRLKQRSLKLAGLRSFLRGAEACRAAERGGASWARREWLRALDAMLAGQTPSVAFGMAAPGRRPAVGFSTTDDIAVCIEHEIRRTGAVEPVIRSVHSFTGHGSAGIPDERVVRRKREVLRSLSDKDIEAMARDAAAKLDWPFTPTI